MLQVELYDRKLTRFERISIKIGRFHRRVVRFLRSAFSRD